MIAYFYDDNKNFINSTDGYFYRRVAVPSEAKYIRVTILEESYPTDLSIQYFRVPTHCAFKNIKFENCRCVGLAQSAMKDMLVENCEFTNCGQSSAKCANEDFLLKLPHYSMKKPISIIDCDFTSSNSDGMVVFYDDTTGCSACELVEQDMLVIKGNEITMDNSQFVVSGICEDTVNNINIRFEGNELLSDKLKLYDDECKKCENIKILDN